MPIKVVFEPDNLTVTGREGDSLLDLAAAAGIPVRAQCGGQGTCGGCRMIVRRGRIIDLTKQAFAELADTDRGLIPIEIQILPME